MAISSKNPVQGYVPCQLCGKPAPTHYPKGGPRKSTLYYNCIEHKNQSGAGVGEYCEAHQVKTLLEYAQKYDAVDECAALQVELENAGLLETIVSEDEIEYVEAQEEECDLLDDEPQTPSTALATTEQDDVESKPSNGAAVFFLLLLLLVGGGVVFAVAKKLKASAPQPQPAEKTAAPKAPEIPPQEEPKQEGVLL
ncbi:MAG: hypothetical protein HWE27_05285 [Gammaproteobacteria bacterium]|nr:hypothetical protein [Gammaproteobacteria bacterium]